MKTVTRSGALLLLLIAAAEACMKVTPGEPGIPATPCKNCAQNLITKTKMTAGAQEFDSDTTVTTGGCAVRTFVCKGMQASIEAFGANGDTLGSFPDDGMGTATLAVTCNTAGNAWQKDGTTITRVECSAVPACRTCAQATPAVIMMAMGSKAFDMDTTDYATGCAVRTFTCIGRNANIEIFEQPGVGHGVFGDMGTGTATVMLKCSADGMSWQSTDNTPIQQIECSTGGPVVPVACKTCTMAQMPTDPMGANSVMMNMDTIDATGACSKRTLVCNGPQAGIALYEGNPPMDLGTVMEDPVGSGTVTTSFTCAADGSGWETDLQAGTKVTRAECINIVAPACQTCAQNLLMVTQLGPNTKMMDMDKTEIGSAGGPACSQRTFTCIGNMASIALYVGNHMPLGEAPGGPVVGTATFTVTCNAAGTAWETDLTNPPTVITGVECQVVPGG